MASNRLPAATLVVLALLFPTFASALTSNETACRDALAQAVTRYASVAAKAVTRCHQRRSDGQRSLATDCNNVAEADSDGKVVASRAKLRSAALAACSSAESLLGFYAGCPAPAAGADDGGATGGIDDFGEVVDCLFALGDAHVGAFTHDAQGAPDDRLLDPLVKCQGRLGKGGSRLLTTVLAGKRRCQEEADRSGDGDYTCDAADPRGSIASAAARFPQKTAPYCDFDSSVISQLDACADDRDGLLACAAASADSHGRQLVRSAYVLDGSTTTSTTTTTTSQPPTTTTTTTTLPGTACGDTAPQCNGSCPTGTSCQTGDGGGCTCASTGTGACAPATVKRQILSRFTPGIDSATALNAGWSGLALDIDVPDRAGDMVDLDCDENCENCEVTMHRDPDGTLPACHCTSDSSKQCGVVNGSDPDSCGSIDPTCRCYFGAPLAISASGNPACVGLRIRNDYTGTANLRTGEWHDTLNLAAVVYLGFGTTNPCPNCEGDAVPNDGIKGGTCSGGLGGACDVQGVHSTFGAVSHDCLPPSAANISGTGLIIDVGLTTDESRLDAGLPCDTPSGALCPCRTCTGNSLLSCSNDEQCAAIGAGVCTASGGAGVRKNMCDNFECSPNWQCTIGPVETYCDGAVFPDGRGYIPCTSNSDCAAGEGACTLPQLRGCTPDPVVNVGRADIENPTSVSAFCVAPTSNPAINIGSGLPGPGSLLLTFENHVFCQNDPTVPYEFPDGANCGDFSTTTTTLLPLPQCADADAPACGGVCPVGSVCQDGGSGTCSCIGLPLPPCGDSEAPSCGGICGNPGEVCMDDAGTCDCKVVTLPQCTDAAAPVCGGVCPNGELCQSVGDSCECGAPGVPSCGAALAPACGGVCDVGEACVANSAGTGCECLHLPLPSCAESAPPLCLGTCSTGNTCGAIGDACICSVVPLP